MKRHLQLSSLLVLLVLLLTACQGTEDTKDYTSLLDSEFTRIATHIPNEYSSDYRLPGASSAFVLRYTINGEDISDYMLEYKESDQDQIFNLKLTLTYQDQTKEYNLTITSLSDEEIIEDPEEVSDVLDYLNQSIPDPIVSNITLDQPSIEADTITYTTTCGDIERGRLVYSYPDTNQPCTITYNITIDQDTETYVLTRTISSVDTLPKLPRVYIVTDGTEQVNSKDNYVTGNITVVTYDDVPYPEVSNESMKIRIRGNSTAGMPKLSYKVKFDEQVRFLNQYAEHDWVLLANFTDQTLIRNALAFSLAERMRMPYPPTYTFVDVYLNGEYQGNYLLTDQIEITGDRIDIEENVSDIDTGYLLEWDNTQYLYGLGNTDDNYFLIDGIPFVLHSPDWDDEHYQPAHLTYIENYMNAVFQTLEDKNDYHDLIDEASFIDWFIVNEVFKNVDSGYSSVYYYKYKGGLLYMGPVWDFDLSTGNQGHANEDERGPTGWYTPLPYKNVLFYYLMQYPEFQQALQERWMELYDDVIVPTIDEVWTMADSITSSQYHNFERWDIIGSNWSWYTAPEIFALTTYDEQVWFLHDYLVTRIEWLDEEIRNL